MPSFPIFILFPLLIIQTAFASHCVNFYSLDKTSSHERTSEFRKKFKNAKSVYDFGDIRDPDANRMVIMDLGSEEKTQKALVKSTKNYLAITPESLQKFEFEAAFASAFKEKEGQPRKPTPAKTKCYMDLGLRQVFLVHLGVSGTFSMDCRAEDARACYLHIYITLPQVERLKILLNLAENVETIHGKDLVLAQLNPEDIGVQLKPDGSFDRTVITDFTAAESTSKTCQNGTPISKDLTAFKYIAGKIKAPKNPACEKPMDVYAFAILFFRLEAAARPDRIFKGVDPFQDNMRIVNNCKGEAICIYNALRKIISETETLKSMGIFKCVDGGEAYSQKVCLFKLYYGILHEDRAERMGLSKFIELLEYFIDKYDTAEDMTDVKIKNVQTKGIEKSAWKENRRIVV